MNKIRIIIVILICNIESKAQIILEHTYGYYHKNFWVTDLGNNDYKYVIEDSTGFSLYNLDHSLYLSVIVPVLIWRQPHDYEVAYITKSLFDSDSTNIEYVIGTAFSRGNFYVYRTDGTLIFERDSVVGPLCTGCALGSVWTQPIFNTPEGAKLLLFSMPPNSDPDSISVYSLCGTAPTFIKEVSSNGNYVKIYPNPTSGMINFEIMPPNNQEKFTMTIYDSNLQLIEQSNVAGKNYQLNLSNRSLSSGIYFFDLKTENKVFQTGKFVITR